MRLLELLSLPQFEFLHSYSSILTFIWFNFNYLFSNDSCGNYLRHKYYTVIILCKATESFTGIGVIVALCNRLLKDERTVITTKGNMCCCGVKYFSS